MNRTEWNAYVEEEEGWGWNVWAGHPEARVHATLPTKGEAEEYLRQWVGDES